MKCRCLLVDDEPLARKLLKEYLEPVEFIEVIGEAENALKAKEFLKQGSVDLMFLDINMPGLSGIDFIKIIDNPPIVVYATAYPNFAVEAFELEAFDYLVKPIAKDRFDKTIRKLQNQWNQHESGKDTSSSIRIKEGKRLYKVNPENIFLIQAYGDYVKIFTADKVFVSKIRLLAFSRQLPNQFLQVHRSNFVNLNHVEYLEGNHLKIGNQKIPISNTYRQAFLDRM